MLRATSALRSECGAPDGESAFFLACAVKADPPRDRARGCYHPRARETAKISGSLAGVHCLRGELVAHLRELRLDLGRDRRELLGALTQLLDQLAVELGLLGEQLAAGGGGEAGMHAGEA